MCSVNRHDLREKVCHLLTVKVNLQNALARFDVASMHEVGSGVQISQSRELLNCRYTRQSFRLRIHTSCSFGHEWRFLHTRLPSEPSALIPRSSDESCSVSWKTVHWIPFFFRGTLENKKLLRSLTSPAQSASVMTNTEPRGVSAAAVTSSEQPSFFYTVDSRPNISEVG